MAICLQNKGMATCLQNKGMTTCLQNKGMATCLQNNGTATCLQTARVWQPAYRAMAWQSAHLPQPPLAAEDRLQSLELSISTKSVQLRYGHHYHDTLFQKNGYDFNACNNVTDILCNTDVVNFIVKLIVHSHVGKSV